MYVNLLNISPSLQIREITVAVGGGAIIFAVTTLLCIKFVTIMATSIVGSTMIMAAIDFFMHNSRTIHWVRSCYIGRIFSPIRTQFWLRCTFIVTMNDRHATPPPLISLITLQILDMKANPEPPPCWGGLLICIFPCVIIFSILVQCFLTAWRIDHKQQSRTRRRPMPNRANSRPRETREEARQRKYRYLYQVRTARGDIISQVSVDIHYELWLLFYCFIRQRTLLL